MGSSKKFYVIYSLLILLEIINLVAKLFSVYHFNLLILIGTIIATSWLGWESKVNRIFLVTFMLITLLLTITMIFIVWN